jgi:hypothetical protein
LTSKFWITQRKDLSIGAAYNKLAETCEGEWIMYLGDDDELVPEYILSLNDLRFANGSE